MYFIYLFFFYISGTEEILQYVHIGQYQLACAKYFEITHNAPILTGVNHPNQYFEESQKILVKGKPNIPVNNSGTKPTTSNGTCKCVRIYVK